MPAPRIPGVATSEGPADQNSPPPMPMRTPKARTAQGDGPKLGSRGEYLPASYPTRSGAIREDR